MKKPITPAEKFMRDIEKSLATYYSHCLSEKIKRGIAAAKARKLSSLANSLAV